MQAALERAMHDLAFGPEVDPGDGDAIRGWLKKNQVSSADAEAILSSGIERLVVYRRLIRGNLRDAIELAIPRTVARLGALFDHYFDRFLAERGPRTHYLRDVTRELLDYCEPLWKADPRVEPHLLDLARHENVQIEIGAMQARPAGAEPGELAIDRGVVFIEAARVMRYAFAVHRLSEAPADRSPPAAEPTALLVYRNPEHEVRYLELTPLAAHILERLLAGDTLGRAVSAGCSQERVELTPDVLDGTAQLLADLAQRGALLGAA